MPNGEKIPTLAQLFELINNLYMNNKPATEKRKKLKINIELKDTNPLVVIKVLQVAQQCN